MPLPSQGEPKLLKLILARTILNASMSKGNPASKCLIDQICLSYTTQSVNCDKFRLP